MNVAAIKLVKYLTFCFTMILLVSCSGEAVSPEVDVPAGEASIKEVQVGGAVVKDQTHQLTVIIHKPTPCHQLVQTKISATGTTVNYNFILESSGEICAQVIEEETVQIAFTPQSSGVYTLKFSIDGRLYRTKQVVVGE